MVYYLPNKLSLKIKTSLSNWKTIYLWLISIPTKLLMGVSTCGGLSECPYIAACLVSINNVTKRCELAMKNIEVFIQYIYIFHSPPFYAEFSMYINI